MNSEIKLNDTHTMHYEIFIIHNNQKYTVYYKPVL